MGLLSRFASNRKNQPMGEDDVLLLHGMMLMAGADGIIEGPEIATLQAFFNTLPEFEGKDFDELLAEANKVVSRFGSLKDSIKALEGIVSVPVRKKLFVLAVDIALASGDVHDSEDEVLSRMQKLLEVDDEEAERIMGVLALKYSR